MWSCIICRTSTWLPTNKDFLSPPLFCTLHSRIFVIGGYFHQDPACKSAEMTEFQWASLSSCNQEARTCSSLLCLYPCTSSAETHWQAALCTAPSQTTLAAQKKKRNLFNCMESSVQFPAIFCAVENLCLTTAWCCLCLRVCVRACQVGWQAVRLPWLVRELFCLNQLGPPVSLQSSQCRPHGLTPLWKVPLSLTQLDTHTQTGWHIECKP